MFNLFKAMARGVDNWREGKKQQNPSTEEHPDTVLFDTEEAFREPDAIEKLANEKADAKGREAAAKAIASAEESLKKMQAAKAEQQAKDDAAIGEVREVIQFPQQADNIKKDARKSLKDIYPAGSTVSYETKSKEWITVTVVGVSEDKNPGLILKKTNGTTFAINGDSLNARVRKENPAEDSMQKAA